MKKKFDRFVLRQHLSEGPGGSVYQADEALAGDLTRTVALKILPAATSKDPKASQRFHEQLKLLIDLAGHPNIVSVYAIGETDGSPWMVLEWIPSTLTQVLRDPPVSPEHVIGLLRQIASALQALHGLTPPVLHNDLSPDNILVDRFGGYKVTDFGLAGPAHIERTRVLATVRYAAPELLSRDFGPLSPATDLYALGHIAYELSLGQKLYRQQFPAVYDSRATGHEGTASRWMAWHCSQDTRAADLHAILSEFPETLSKVVARLMEKNPEKRYQSADSLLHDLLKDVPHDLRSNSPSAVAAQQASGPAQSARASDQPPALSAAEKSVVNTLLVNDSPGDLRYFVRLGPRTAGPFDLPTLRRLAARGEVSRLHRISSDRATWKSITTIEGIF